MTRSGDRSQIPGDPRGAARHGRDVSTEFVMGPVLGSLASI